MTENNNFYLVFVKDICKNTDNTYEYDFMFSDSPYFAWGEEWNVDNPSNNGDLTPEIDGKGKIIRIKTTLPLKTYQNTTCYSMEYVTYGIFAICWIDIDNLEEYPENGRLTMYFGESEESIIDKINLYEWSIIAEKDLE